MNKKTSVENNYPLSNLSEFEVMLSSPLSEFERKMVLKLYMPIVGDKVISLYQTLFSLVEEGKFESDIFYHEKIVKLMHLRSIERFADIRNKLEAIGLLDTYYKDNLYVYLLKKPLDPIDFFNNSELSSLLEYQIGSDAYINTYCEFIMRKIDLSKFEKITTSFDNVYDIETSDNILLSQTIYSGKNNGIVLDNKKFDYQCFWIMVSAHDVIDEKYYADQEFIDKVKRYSFLYQLNIEELKEVVIMSCNEDKILDYNELARNAKLLYNRKGKKLGVVPKTKISDKAKSNNKLINFLETASPNEFVKQKTGVSLTGSEIEMFDQLLRDTNINVGVLNVLIGYVLEELNGQIPSYNYYIKIINTWRRAKVNSTMDAIDYISNKGKQKSSSKSFKEKNEKTVPNWYNDYVEDLNNKKPIKKSSSDNVNKDLKDLEAFFNPDNKE